MVVHRNSFSVAGFWPQGGCLGAISDIGLHPIPEALVFLSYLLIFCALVYLARLRKDLKFHGLIACFAAFILAGGAADLLDIWNIGHTHDWVSGGLKAIAVLSAMATAIGLVKLAPQSHTLPGPPVPRAAWPVGRMPS